MPSERAIRRGCEPEATVRAALTPRCHGERSVASDPATLARWRSRSSNGGIVGCAAARFSRGRRPLSERGGIGAGASGRNQGVLRGPPRSGTGTSLRVAAPACRGLRRGDGLARPPDGLLLVSDHSRCVSRGARARARRVASRGRAGTLSRRWSSGRARRSPQASARAVSTPVSRCRLTRPAEA